MSQMSQVKRAMITAVCIALCVVLPMAFHSIQNAGAIFCPMHIPVLGEEAETIRMAQTARGARFESKRLTERAASFLPLVIPVFLAAFRRADELACAMEARGYRGSGQRTKKKKLLPNRNGNVAIAASAIFLIMQVFLQK